MFPNITMQVVGWAIIMGILLGIFIDLYRTPYIEVVYAEEPIREPKEVRLEVIYNWDDERVVEEIRETFPETPDLAIKIARCESNFKMIQSHHQQPYGREESFGIFQIHARAWHDTAVTLGYENYQTDIRDNLAMARWIYDNHGWYPWSCLKMV